MSMFWFEWKKIRTILVTTVVWMFCMLVSAYQMSPLLMFTHKFAIQVYGRQSFKQKTHSMCACMHEAHAHDQYHTTARRTISQTIRSRNEMRPNTHTQASRMCRASSKVKRLRDLLTIGESISGFVCSNSGKKAIFWVFSVEKVNMLSTRTLFTQQSPWQWQIWARFINHLTFSTFRTTHISCAYANEWTFLPYNAQSKKY